MKLNIPLLYLIVALGIVSPLVSNGQATSCPENIDFEAGTTDVWSFFTGTCCTAGRIVATTASGPVINRHTLTSGTGVDAYGGFPIVAPGGGSYSLRLGNSNTGGQAEKARYYVHVPSGVTNYALIYRFAVVLEDPSSHTVAQKPRFEVTATDSASGNPVPCAQYTYVATSSLPGFTRSSTGGGDVYYKSWSTANINLSGLGGSTIIIDFASGDCSLGAHFGYGYIDMSCGLFAIDNIACDTGDIELTAPPGFDTYSWYDSSDLSTLIDTGQNVRLHTSASTTYAVVMQPFSGYGCPDTLYTRVTPSALTLHPTPDTTLCFATAFSITSGATDIVSPLTYAWSSSSYLSCTTCANPVISPTSSSTYYVTVTNPYGCSQTDTINLYGNFITVDIDHTNASCYDSYDGSSTVSITSGYTPLTYAWSTSPVQTTAIATGLGPGIYFVTLTDTNGCIGVLSDTVFSPPARVISFGTNTNPTTCGGSDGSITITGLDPGSRDTLEYRNNGRVYTFIVTASGSGSYTFTGLRQGIYDTFRVLTQGCRYNTIGPVTLTDPPLPPLPYINSNSPVCENDTLQFNSFSSGAGITYSWTGPGGFTSTVQNPLIASASLSDAGDYYIAVSRANCFVYDTIHITIKEHPHPVANTNSPVCAGDSLFMTCYSTNGADRYFWNGPGTFNSFSQNINRLVDTTATGTYTVTITKNGCSTSITTNVIVNGTPTPPVTMDTTYCQFGTAVALHATGLNLLWFGADKTGPGVATAPIPSTNITGVSTWYVTQTSPAGCTSDFAAIRVQVIAYPKLSLSLSDTVACIGGYITLTANNSGESYSRIKWLTGDGDSVVNSSPIIHSYRQAGVYTVTVSTSYDVCGTRQEQREISIFSNPALNLGPDTTVCFGNGMVTLTDLINGGNDQAHWVWSSGETTHAISINKPGTYYVKVNINGCEVSDTVVISNGCYIVIPNAFSPNGDGLNETFMPRPYFAKGLKNFKMTIFNRWGQEVFVTTRLDGGGWDGKFNDTPQPQGVYVYMIEAMFIDGTREDHHGNFTLLR